MSRRRTRVITVVPALAAAIIMGVVLGSLQTPLWATMAVVACLVVAVVPSLLLANRVTQE